MSKLFKLKEWVSVPEAAQHLAAVYGETVEEKDVLYFALQRQLVLSVYFVNHARARKGRIVGIDDVQYRELDGALTAQLPQLPEHQRGKPLQYISSLPIDDNNDRFINFEDDIARIDGVWDLLMEGGERLDVENRYHELTEGPPVTLISLEGCFVTRGNEICQLQERLDDNEYQEGSDAQRRVLTRVIDRSGMDARAAEELLGTHAEFQSEFDSQRRRRPASHNYYPAASLPEDSVLVVRTAALTTFINCLAGGEHEPEKPLKERERGNLYNIIAALKTELSLASTSQLSDAAIIASLEESYPDLDGCSKANLEKVFPAANKRLKTYREGR